MIEEVTVVKCGKSVEKKKENKHLSLSNEGAKLFPAEWRLLLSMESFESKRKMKYKYKTIVLYVITDTTSYFKRMINNCN